MKKRAFTLAEVLVALAIVGVIAALTLPNIMRLNQEAGIGPMLASVQTSVEEAAGRMLVDNPNKTLSKMDADGLFIGYLNRQLAMLDKTNDANPNAQGYALTNGAILNFVAPTGTVPAGTAFKDVVVDINGENRPNANGIDKFTFTLSSNGFLAPQGCAKVISDNNWKVPKDYDPAACNPTAYTPSGGTGGVVTGEDCELPKILMPDGTCCNPATDPTCQFAPQTCEPTPCDEPDLEDWIQTACACVKVRKRCPDGSIIDINANCQSGGEPEGETKTCLNGDVIDVEEDCPVQCWDDSWVQNILDCPIEPSETKTCDDGSVVDVDEDCPVECWDGSWVQDLADCPNNPNQPNPAKLRKTYKKGVYCRCSNDQGGYTQLTHYYWDKAAQSWVELEGVYSVNASTPGNYDVYDGPDAGEIKDYFNVGW